MNNNYWGDEGAGCLFFAKNTGRFGLVLRSGMVQEPSTYGLAGGKLDEGESFREALEREVWEEIKFDINKLQSLIFLDDYKDEGFIYKTFLGIAPFEFTTTLDWESTKFDWYDLGSFPTPLHPGLKATLAKPDVMTKLKNLVNDYKVQKTKSSTKSKFDEHLTKISNNLKVRDTNNKKLDENLFKDIADYHDMVLDDRNGKAINEAYNAFKKETLIQYQMLVDAGYKIEPFIGEGEPYTNSKEMIKDVRENKHLYYLMSKSATGQNDKENLSNYTLFEDTGLVLNGQRVLYNDLFRAVHDIFGHANSANSFSAQGELNAFYDHSKMYSDRALPALFLETVVYNAWFNYGRHRRNMKGEITPKTENIYAPRKIYYPDTDHIRALMEQFVISEGRKKKIKQQKIYAGGVLFISKTGKIGLALRAEGGSYPNTWGAVGGKIETGETIKEGVIREVREEIGINLPENELTFLLSNEEEDGVNYSYYIFVSKDEFGVKLNEENKQFKWFGLNEIPDNTILDLGDVIRNNADRFKSYMATEESTGTGSVGSFETPLFGGKMIKRKYPPFTISVNEDKVPNIYCYDL